ncbi:hypothetical protein [Gordonia sp. CNJ-863]|uniref:hypothetical protein n=1 Tax=Gordonia sp. CNJ-863 TaxID=1904963 RepID=UPI0011153D87|nr:hypothetical protein [Gordonia sp. CNJ-863]
MAALGTELKQLSPLIAAHYRGFILLNLLLGPGLIIGIARTNEFFIINGVLTYQFWGALFLILGLAQLAAYVRNSLQLMRIFLLCGLGLQMLWCAALTVRQVEELDANVFLLLFFSLIAYFKFFVYLHFPNKPASQPWTRR